MAADGWLARLKLSREVRGGEGARCGERGTTPLGTVPLFCAVWLFCVLWLCVSCYLALLWLCALVLVGGDRSEPPLLGPD